MHFFFFGTPVYIIKMLFSLQLMITILTNIAAKTWNYNNEIPRIMKNMIDVCNCLCLVIFSDYCQCIHVDL